VDSQIIFLIIKLLPRLIKMDSLGKLLARLIKMDNLGKLQVDIRDKLQVDSRGKLQVDNQDLEC
jgi:hypothetical protein